MGDRVCDWDRLYLWLVAACPVLLMLGAILIPYWRKLAAARRNRQIIFTGVAFAACAAFIFGDVCRRHPGAGHIHVQEPRLLWLIAPLAALLLLIQSRTLAGISRGCMWTAFLLRGAILALLLLALAGLQMVVERDALSVLFALDVSKSVPEAERQRALEFMKKALPARQASDEAGLLVFGGKAAVEVSPTPLFSPPELKNIKSQVAPDATDVAAALRRAAAAFDEGGARRVVLFTDGKQTTGDAAEELKRLVSLGVDVWLVPLKSGDTAEMLVEKVVLPNELMWEQPYECHVFVKSNVTARARVRLYPGDRAGVAALEQLVDLVPGKNRVTFAQDASGQPLRMHSGGAKEVKAVLEPLNPADDTLSENNTAYAFTDVQTESRVLIMTSDLAEVKFLLGALEGEKLTLDVRAGASLPDNPEEYRAYDCIVLANLARGFLSEPQMKVIESCVKDQGAGLVMLGGEQSFGAGGYLHTPVEDALPVQMDLENQRVLPSGALCIVLHTCEFGEGNAWGKKITKAAINVLAPQDFAGVICYGNGPGEQWIFKPTLVARKQWMFGLIDGCEPGDMPSLDRIVAMAVDSLGALNNISLKHCIIITDGDPSPPLPATIDKAKNGAVTITTISIFPHGGIDIAALKDLASQTGGRYYEADDPKKLPQIFVKEAAVVRRSLIYPASPGPPVPVSLGVPGPTLKEFGDKFPNVNALVMTQARARAELQLYTRVEGEKVPLLASWHYGLGKAVAFTSDATNRWAPEWVQWPGYRKFWANLFTWVSRRRMPPNHLVTTWLDGDTARVTVEGFDAKGDYLNFAKLTGTAVDPDVARNNPDGKTYDLNFSMTAPGRYEAAFPAQKAGAYAITVIDQSDPAQPQSIVTGLANSYSAEFQDLAGGDALLAQLGEIATGRFPVSRLKDLATLEKDPAHGGLFAHDLPPAQRPAELFPWLLAIALCLLPLDIAVRRLALDPERAFLWLTAKLQPAFVALKLKKRQLQSAAADALAGGPATPPPTDVVPSGEQSREAQSRYAQAGDSAAAQELNLNPTAQDGAEAKPAVGGTKVSPADQAASDYTRALLKAKRKAKKKDGPQT